MGSKDWHYYFLVSAMGKTVFRQLMEKLRGLPSWHLESSTITQGEQAWLPLPRSEHREQTIVIRLLKDQVARRKGTGQALVPGLRQGEVSRDLSESAMSSNPSFALSWRVRIGIQEQFPRIQTSPSGQGVYLVGRMLASL